MSSVSEDCDVGLYYESEIIGDYADDSEDNITDFELEMNGDVTNENTIVRKKKPRFVHEPKIETKKRLRFVFEHKDAPKKKRSNRYKKLILVNY